MRTAGVQWLTTANSSRDEARWHFGGTDKNSDRFNVLTMKRALITGIAGQDGSYLAELLLEKGYEVHGLVRRAALEDPERRLWRLLAFKRRLRLHAASLENFASVRRVIAQLKPHECYHLAAQSAPFAYSFEDEFCALTADIKGTCHVLSALKDCAPACRFYFAGSSAMFGKVAESPQTEHTPFQPRSAYGISKVAGFDLTRNYRESFGLRGWSGILYDHESPRRGTEFVSRTITSQVARIKLGLARDLKLGDLEAQCDWGHAKEYVDAMWRMLQSDTPDDYVIATGETHSVREFAAAAFAHAGLEWQDFVKVDARLHGPVEAGALLGDAAKARHALGWSAQTKFKDLVAEMVDEDLRMLKGNRFALHFTPREAGAAVIARGVPALGAAPRMRAARRTPPREG